MTDAEFDAMHGGRELLPIEQAIYEAEGAERFARFHGHGRKFPNQAEEFVPNATPPTAQPAPQQHAGMTIAGEGASMLGKIMREQRASRLGVYPDGNPNTATHPAQPAPQQGEAIPVEPSGSAVRDQVFALCEATEDAALPELDFNRGRKFEAKQIRKALGAWHWDATHPAQPAEQAGDAGEDAARWRTLMRMSKTEIMNALSLPPTAERYKAAGRVYDLQGAVDAIRAAQSEGGGNGL